MRHHMACTWPVRAVGMNFFFGLMCLGAALITFCHARSGGGSLSFFPRSDGGKWRWGMHILQQAGTILAFCHDHFVREKNTSALILWNSTRSIPLFILSHIHMIAKRKQDHLQYKFLFEVSYHSIRRGNKWSELLFRCQAAVLQQNAVWGLPASGDGNYSQHTVKHGITSASACAPQVLVCQSSRKRTTRHKEGSPRRQNQEELLMKCETLLEARVAEVKCGHTARTRTARAVAWCFRYLTSSLAQSRHGEVYNSKGNFLNRRFSMAKRVEYEQIQS